MATLDRRIGWLFVLFLGLLAIAVFKAADLGLLQAGTLQQAAVTQQVTRDVIPASRGADHRPQRRRAGHLGVRR